MFDKSVAPNAAIKGGQYVGCFCYFGAERQHKATGVLGVQLVWFYRQSFIALL
jgi:hypothetical protein